METKQSEIKTSAGLALKDFNWWDSISIAQMELNEWYAFTSLNLRRTRFETEAGLEWSHLKWIVVQKMIKKYACNRIQLLWSYAT